MKNLAILFFIFTFFSFNAVNAQTQSNIEQFLGVWSSNPGTGYNPYTSQWSNNVVESINIHYEEDTLYVSYKLIIDGESYFGNKFVCTYNDGKISYKSYEDNEGYGMGILTINSKRNLERTFKSYNPKGGLTSSEGYAEFFRYW